MDEEQLKEKQPEEQPIPQRSKRGKKKAGKEKSAIREMLEVVITAFILALLIKTFIVGNFWIPSQSMVPTIEVDDKVIVTNFSYWFNEPQRDDIIVFKYPLDTKKDYIKRCIGLPGETIEFRDNQLYVDGIQVDQPYLADSVVTEDFGPVLVPEGQYFMCGDNRSNSSDSRVWGFVEEKLIIGKAQCIYWPLDRLGSLY